MYGAHSDLSITHETLNIYIFFSIYLFIYFIYITLDGEKDGILNQVAILEL